MGVSTRALLCPSPESMTTPPSEVEDAVRRAALNGDVSLRGIAAKIKAGGVKKIVAVCGAWASCVGGVRLVVACVAK